MLPLLGIRLQFFSCPVHKLVGTVTAVQHDMVRIKRGVKMLL